MSLEYSRDVIKRHIRKALVYLTDACFAKDPTRSLGYAKECLIKAEQWKYNEEIYLRETTPEMVDK